MMRMMVGIYPQICPDPVIHTCKSALTPIIAQNRKRENREIESAGNNGKENIFAVHYVYHIDKMQYLLYNMFKLIISK